MPECYVRGSTIKYLRIPDEVIDMVKEEVIGKGRGRGDGKGRGGQRGRGQRGGEAGGGGAGCWGGEGYTGWGREKWLWRSTGEVGKTCGMVSGMEVLHFSYAFARILRFWRLFFSTRIREALRLDMYPLALASCTSNSSIRSISISIGVQDATSRTFPY